MTADQLQQMATKNEWALLQNEDEPNIWALKTNFGKEFQVDISKSANTDPMAFLKHILGHDVDGITRVTGYFSRTSHWNAGKAAELKVRKRETDARFHS